MYVDDDRKTRNEITFVKSSHSTKLNDASLTVIV